MKEEKFHTLSDFINNWLFWFNIINLIIMLVALLYAWNDFEMWDIMFFILLLIQTLFVSLFTIVLKKLYD